MSQKAVSFDVAILAKELGFDVPTSSLYSISDKSFYDKIKELHIKNNFNDEVLWGKNAVSAPTQSELQTWFREVHKMHINPEYAAPDTNKYTIRIDWYNSTNTFGFNGSVYPAEIKRFDFYEHCLEYGLLTGLRLLEKNNLNICSNNLEH